MINKIKEIIFDYKGHEQIFTKIHATVNEKDKTITSNVLMKIEEEKDNKYFTNEKIFSSNSLFETFSGVFYYDRITATLETDALKKVHLSKIFQKPDVKNVLLVSNGITTDVFENIDTKEIKFLINNNALSKKHMIENFEEIFFKGKIDENHLDIINSFRFSIVSYQLSQNIIDKVSKNMANTLIREYPEAFNRKVTFNDIPMISEILSKHFMLKYFNNESFKFLADTSELTIDIDEVIDLDSKSSKYFDTSISIMEQISDAKNLRNYRNFLRVLTSDDALLLARTNIPLQNEINRIKNIRFDSILVNQNTSDEELNNLSEYYKNHNLGNICVQDKEEYFINKNLFAFAVDKTNPQLSLTAALNSECKDLNKIIDLREIEDIEVRKKIFAIVYSNQNENITFITNRVEDISFISSRMKNGNIYGLDAKYLNENDNSGKTIYIADVLEISYSYEINFSPLIEVSPAMSKKVISFPEYDASQSYIKNISNIKSQFIEKIVAQKDAKEHSHILTGKIDSFYKYEKLLLEKTDFNLDAINKEFKVIKQSEDFYNFAKGSIGKFFKGNLELIFSSFNVAKDKQVFNNDFYYNANGKLSIADLDKSIALASHVSRMPTGEIISKIAKKFNVNIEADKPFSLSNTEQNKLNVGKKDFVTSDKLGAMKFGYLPKTFELKEEDKTILVDMVGKILADDKTSTPEITEKNINIINKVLSTSSFLTLKNEQTVIDAKRFAPKEVLVLIDENLNDVAKLNISVTEFYKELEERKIFDIYDYIEIAKVNTQSLERISNGLSNMISDFKEEHLKFKNIENSEILSAVHEVRVSKKYNDEKGNEQVQLITALDILISNAQKEVKDKLFLEIGNKFDIANYYKTFLEFETMDSLVSWVNKQDLNQMQKLKIENVLTSKVKGNEILMVEQKSVELLSYFEKIIGEDKQEIYQNLEEKIFKLYHDKKTENNVVIKTMKMYAIETLMKETLNELKNIDKTLTKKEISDKKHKLNAILKKCLDIASLDIMGLTPAQYNEALNFSVLKSNDMKDTQMLFWEMRQGKTRAAIASKLFASFVNPGKQVHRNIMMVQNKNLDDIAEQVVDYFPLLAKDIIFNSSEKVYLFKINKSIEYPVNIAKQVTPQVIQLMKERIKFQGQKNSLKSDTAILANTYTKDMNRIYKLLNNITLEDLLVKFEKSPFIDILKLTDKKKVDKDIEKAILQSFLYIQTMYEKKYIKASDAEFAFEKMKNFVEKIIDSKDRLHSNKLSKYGIDLIPKNVMYSINVDSPNTNVVLDKKVDIMRFDNKKFATPFELIIDEKGETQLINIESAATRNQFAEVIESTFTIDKKTRELSNDGKFYKTVTTNNHSDILSLKEAQALSFVYKNLKNISDEFDDYITAYIKQRIDSSSLVASPLYRIDGLDEQVQDSIETNLFELYNPESVEDFFKASGFSEKQEAKNFIKLIEDKETLVEFATQQNIKNFNNTLFYLYNTTLSATTAKRLELISPLTYKKYKELASSFTMDMELKGNTLVYPIRKYTDESKTSSYFYDSFEIFKESLDLDNLAKNSKTQISGLAVNFTYANSNAIITVKREQNPDLSLDLIVKRNDNLNSAYTIDLKADIANITIDESHKGLKKTSANLTIHDVTAYLHKLALSNNGSFTSISGTPLSGMARDIGKIMTTGVDIELSSNITKNIDNYCTSFEFKDDLDAMIFSSIEAFPDGHIYNALKKTITIPDDRKNVSLENLKLTDIEIEGIRGELTEIINSIPNLDIDDKRELKGSKASKTNIEKKFEYYKEIYKIEEAYQKISSDKIVRRKENDVKGLLFSKIDVFAKKVPGINNFATLADIIRKVGSNNSVNISRVSDNASYNILDIDILKKQTAARDTKHSTAIKLINYKDRTLALGAFLDSYKSKLKLGQIKEKVNMIFESWVIDIFSEANFQKTIRYLGLDSKFDIKDSINNDESVMKINDLRSRSGKSINNSSTDIFNVLYFGSEKEKYELSSNKDLKEKVNFVVSLLDKFIEFSEKYDELHAKSRVVYENEKARAKAEDRVMDSKNLHFNFDGFLYDASKYEDLSNDLENIHIFKPNSPTTNGQEINIVTLSNDGAILINNIPIVFKTEININKWENFLNHTIDLNYSLTNKNESEILEYVASDSSLLYKQHIDNGENIRVMSGRNANLVISLMDTIDALAHREDKEKKAVIIFNKNESKHYNFSKILDSIEPDFLENNNIELKVTKSSTFASALYEIQKNKNLQIAVVGNYVALAEGIDMSCIDTGFYVGSLRESAETIQSFARQRGHNKDVSNIYLGNNGIFERYKILKSASIADYTIDNTPFKSLTKSLFSGNIEMIKSSVDESIKDLEQLNFASTTASIIVSTNTTLARLEAYEAVMSGRYPAQYFDYDKQLVLSFSENFKRDIDNNGNLIEELKNDGVFVNVEKGFKTTSILETVETEDLEVINEEENKEIVVRDI